MGRFRTEAQRLRAKEATKRWKEKNKDKQNGYAKKHYDTNKDKILAKMQNVGYGKSYKKIAIERGKAFVQNYLSTHPCVDCPESDPVVLEFDHIGDDKLINISQAVYAGWSIDRLAAEIAKCEVRCANCHRKITHRRREATKQVSA